MLILVACEESQRVCFEFRKKGHEAFSCDIEPCSGGHPEWHIQSDVLPLLNGNCEFKTLDGKIHNVNRKWDMILAFPPCTYLTVTSNRWFNEDRYGESARSRKILRTHAIEFFMNFVSADCDRIVIENPKGIMSSVYKKPSQIIQPYYFGDKVRKMTCLWIKGLDNLSPTCMVDPDIVNYKNGRSSDSKWYYDSMYLPLKDRAKYRSKTFPGIAKAMADQWG